MPGIDSDGRYFTYQKDSTGKSTRLYLDEKVNDTLGKPAQDLTDFTKLQYLELSLREPYITRDDYDRAVDLAVKRLRDDQRRYHQKHQYRTEQRARMEQTYKKPSPEWADQGTKSVKRTEPKGQDLVSGPAYQGQTYCSCGMCEGERR